MASAHIKALSRRHLKLLTPLARLNTVRPMTGLRAREHHTLASHTVRNGEPHGCMYIEPSPYDTPAFASSGRAILLASM
eukprot:11123603-Alexandrium_andersonii.AAC.1